LWFLGRREKNNMGGRGEYCSKPTYSIWAPYAMGSLGLSCLHRRHVFFIYQSNYCSSMKGKNTPLKRYAWRLLAFARKPPRVWFNQHYPTRVYFSSSINIVMFLETKLVILLSEYKILYRIKSQLSYLVWNIN